MHTALWRALAIVVLPGIAPAAAVAADAAAEIDAKLKAGGEVAWLIDNSTDKNVVMENIIVSLKQKRVPLVEGAMTVLLEASPDAINAKVLSVDRPKK
ncbi:MAG: hypothetical protein M3Z64_08400 [Verrucomicrobiota bacterium]|nr:hypothetical protein [Verrucomicrobiota bacterium]